MNIERILGIVLMVLGASVLIFTAIIFVNISGKTWDTKNFIIYGTIGIILFISGIRLIRKIEGRRLR